MDKVNQLAEWIRESSRIVFFGGAGTSTESGIPDFRSAAGLYQEIGQRGYSPEEMLSRPFFDREPELFYEFYRSKMLYPDVQPNPVHELLAELEQQGKLQAIITQNIDGLHQKAGSHNVLELHGSVHRNYCMECKRQYTLSDVLAQSGVPRCPVDGGIIRPDVVLYGESLDGEVIDRAVAALMSADLLIIGGTSLTVYPAAGFITYFKGRHTVLMNASSTAHDRHADLLITDPMGQVMKKVQQLLAE
ncbi:NAD-dependent protein deacylase [Paenibacillus bovis]|uniref:NAD-dependent protein deacetylase n=1 Tax=Paenibacillus bovis TaxID=1616788 RepID=A0A172ZL70_9BACL|nr:NAD-dependent protein deacylase [Paenibacillus bovis]ANF97997.1 NAD-dependent protein deacylase [Paenibacillus bovis]